MHALHLAAERGFAATCAGIVAHRRFAWDAVDAEPSAAVADAMLSLYAEAGAEAAAAGDTPEGEARRR